MKTRRLNTLILIAVATILLLGVGYAMWTDSLKIDATATTGELQVEFEEASGHPYVRGINTPYLELDKTHGTDTTTFTMGNMYPGALVTYGVRMDNKGTIPAQISSVDIVFTDDSSEILEAGLDFEVSGYIRQIVSGTDLGVIEKIGKIKLTELEDYLNDNLPGLEFGTNDFIVLDLNISVPAEAGDDYENQSIQFDMTYNFTQFNND